jgi:hypothetical protein
VSFDLATTDATGDTDAAVLDAELRFPGLIAWYRMEDPLDDGTLEDSAGGNHHAACVAGATCPAAVAGRIGSAASFGGVQCARVPYGSWLDTPTAFSISAWIWVDQIVDQVAFGKPFGSGDVNAWSIVAWTPANGPGLCLESVDVNSNNQPVCGPYAPTGTWLHVVGRWTGLSKAVFVNGMMVGERNPAAVAMMDVHDIVIGCDENTGATALFWNGRIDELQVYDRALTDQEIMMLAGG